MKLKHYLKTSGKTKVQLAQECGITRQTLYLILGGQMPSGNTIKKIIRATDQQVTFDDF